MHAWNKPFVIFLILIFCGLIYLLSPVLTPFLVGALLAYLVNPLVNRLTRLKLPRIVSVTIVFIFLFLLLVLGILLLIPLIQSQIDMLIVTVPTIFGWVTDKAFPWVTHFLGTQDYINVETMKTSLMGQWTKAGSLATQFLNTIVHSGIILASWFLDLMIIPVVTFYLLRDWKPFIKGIRDLIPRKMEPTAIKLAEECDYVLSGFFRGQLLVMLSLGIIYAIGLTIVGLKIGIILGLVLGLISIVPYLGAIVGIITASIAAYVQFGELANVLYVCMVFIIGQLTESMFLTPTLIGDRIGLHPVAVIFAVLAGGSLFGFFGVLLALPVVSVLMVGLRFLHQHYRQSRLYQ